MMTLFCVVLLTTTTLCYAVLLVTMTLCGSVDDNDVDLCSINGIDVVLCRTVEINDNVTSYR